MRHLVAEYFQGSDLMIWPLIALAVFIAVFALAVVRLARRGKTAFDEIARLPLEEDRHE